MSKILSRSLAKLQDPAVYGMIAFLCLIVGFCIYGRTKLEAFNSYLNQQEYHIQPQQSAISQASDVIDIPRRKSVRIRDTGLQGILISCTSNCQIDLPLALALMKIESNFDPLATSPVGARGLMQLMPETARRMGLIVHEKVDERLEPGKNMEAGIRYLRMLLDTFDNPVDAIAAYNVGPRVVREGLPSNTQTLQHVYKVIRQQHRYESNAVLMNHDLNLMLRKCKIAKLAMEQGNIDRS